MNEWMETQVDGEVSKGTDQALGTAQCKGEKTASLGTQFSGRGQVILVFSLWKQQCVGPALGPLNSHSL